MADPYQRRGLRWRSKPSFIITTVAVGLFADLFLYGIVVPIVPFMLQDRLSMPDAQVQAYTSGLLAAFAGASVLSSIPAGWVADKVGSRQPPFLGGLLLLLVATTILALGRTVAAFVVARLLQGISAAIVWTSGLAMVQDTVGPKRLGRVIGTMLAIVSVGDVAAPVVGGIIYDCAGIVAVFAVVLGVLAIDLVMRLLVIDSMAVPKTKCSDDRSRQTTVEPSAVAQEDDALIPKDDEEGYRISGDFDGLVKKVPILYCFRKPRFLMALCLSSIQALLRGFFDATVPTEAKAVFRFSSLKVGLLFTALFVPYLALSHVAGLAVDRHGPRVVATVGYAFLAPWLALLALPSQKVVSGDNNMILFCFILVMNGIGLAIVASPGFIAASDVLHKYETANPGKFGKNSPYAQLHGFNSLFYYAGLTVGPLLSGMLTISVGYGITAIIFAAFSGVVAVLSFQTMGEKRRRSYPSLLVDDNSWRANTR